MIHIKALLILKDFYLGDNFKNNFRPKFEEDDGDDDDDGGAEEEAGQDGLAA